MVNECAGCICCGEGEGTDNGGREEKKLAIDSFFSFGQSASGKVEMARARFVWAAEGARTTLNILCFLTLVP